MAIHNRNRKKLII